ncbi:MAG: hypothetical protein HY901_38500 [Deltaproteobacteria bacterium]|nr:hypothetical protein [Deltaproteobacteria bacterium]
MKRHIGRVLGGIVFFAAALAQAAPPPVPAEEAGAMVALLGRIGAISAADAKRLIRKYSLPDRTGREPGELRTCGTSTLWRMREWLRAEGVRILREPPPSAGHVDSALFPVRAFYADESQRTQAQQAVAYAEQAWQRQIVEIGYRAPHTLGDGEPVSAGMDFYFAESDEWAGLTVPLADLPSTSRCDCSSRIFLNSYLAGRHMAGTLEHEFNHSTQAAADCAENISAWEMFAEAAELIAFPNDWSSLSMIREFQKWPQYPLDYYSMSESSGAPSIAYIYGASLFALFLKDRQGLGGAPFLPAAWEAFSQEGTMFEFNGGVAYCTAGNTPNWFDGLDALLATKGSSLRAAFTEFSEWRAIVGWWDDEHHLTIARSISEPSIGASLSRFPVRNWLGVREYGTRYLEYLPSSDDEGPLTVTITGKVETTWSGSVLLWRVGQPVESLPMTFDAQAVATVVTPPLAGITRVLIVVNQLQDATHLPDERDYDNERFFEYRVAQAAGQDAGPPPGPDAAAPGPDAELASPDAQPAGPDAGPAIASDGGPAPESDEGCGCSSSGTGAGLSALMVVAGLVALRRRQTLLS